MHISVLKFLGICFGLIAAIYFGPIEGKVLVVTHSYNRPDFIEYQALTLKKFLKDDYEFIVFNDGPTNKLADLIAKACEEMSIRCIRVPQEIHQQPYLPHDPWEDWNCPSVRTANAIQYSFDTLCFDYDGIVAVIDSDMFLIRDFSIADYLKDYDIAAVAQWRGSMGCVKYIWNGIMFFNMNTLPNKRSLNFNCGTILGNHTDTGGFTYYYFKENPNAKVLYMRDQLDLTDGDYIVNSYELEGRDYIDEEEVLNAVKSNKPLLQFMQEQPDDIQFFLDFAILHYRRAGNYHNKPNKYHKHKTEILRKFMNGILGKETSALKSL